MKRDDRRSAYVGSGKLDAIQIAKLTVGDTVHPIMSIGGDLGSYAGENTRKHIKKQSIEIDADGGTGGKLLVTLKDYFVDQTGTALASGVAVEIDGDTFTTGAGGAVSHAIDCGDGVITTLFDLIGEINILPGFYAFIGDALTTHPVNTDSFIDLDETDLTAAQVATLDTCFRDVSADNIAYLRVGLPRKYDKGPLQIIGLRGLITSATGGLVSVVMDNMDEYKADASHQEVLEEFVPAETLTEHIGGNILDGATVRGSIVIKVAATAITGAAYTIKYRQAMSM